MNDHPSYMTIQDLKIIKKSAEDILSKISADQELDSWVENHITEAKSKIQDVHGYIMNKSNNHVNESLVLNEDIKFYLSNRSGKKY